MSGGGFNRFFGVPFYANAYQTLNVDRFSDFEPNGMPFFAERLQGLKSGAPPI